jgi:2-hydroxychromene-2-carboxylate isomerase
MSRPRLYFSFRSPYSWMSIARLRRAVPDLFDQVDLYPYWDPDPVTTGLLCERGAELPYQPMSKAKHLYVLLDTKRLAESLGLAMRWPVDRGPWWELPHLAWLAARRDGQAQRCYDALVAARWSAGADICDADVVRRVCDDAGLDGDALVDAVARPDIRSEGVDCLESAYHDDVFGVPYLRLGRSRFWGYDRVDLFLEQWRSMSSSPVDIPVGIPVGSYDRDTAGGCG